MRARALIVLFALAACGSDEAPSCQQGIDTYYGAGCSITVDGSTVPRADFVELCRQTKASASNACNDALDEFLSCLDSAEPDNTASCDCSAEFDGLFEAGCS